MEVAIRPEVIVTELEAENRFLRQRLYLSAQAIADLKAERDELQAEIAELRPVEDGTATMDGHPA